MTRFDGFDVGDRRVLQPRASAPPVFAESENSKMPGDGEIFNSIKSAGLFFGVEEIAIPGRFVRVAAI